MLNGGTGNGLCNPVARFYLEPTSAYDRAMSALALTAKTSGSLVVSGNYAEFGTQWEISVASRNSSLVLTRPPLGASWLLVTGARALTACVRTGSGALVSYRCAHSASLTLSSFAGDAILAARKIWYCIDSPGKNEKDEQYWSENFVAKKDGRNWKVSQVLPPGYAGGGLSMSLSAEDGHMLDYELTQ